MTKYFLCMPVLYHVGEKSEVITLPRIQLLSKKIMLLRNNPHEAAKRGVINLPDPTGNY